MAKSYLRLKARVLRKEGKSIKEIARLLEVSQSSVSIWCRDIILSAFQIKDLELRMVDPQYGRRMEYITKLKQSHTEKVFDLIQRGKKDLGVLNKRDIFILGLGLYWGEGFKKDNLLGLATSDITAARFFILWLTECFQIKKEDLLVRVTINAEEEKRIKEVESFWSENLHIPITQFSKPFFQKAKLRKIYENRNEYHGVVRIKLRKSVDKLRIVYGYLEGIKESITA